MSYRCKAPGWTVSSGLLLFTYAMLMPEDTEQFGLTLNGKKRNIRRNDFLKSAAAIGIPSGAAEKMIEKVVTMRDPYLTLCSSSYLPDGLKQRFSELIDEKTQALIKNA